MRRTLTRVQEKNTHRLDNTEDPDGNVVGMYRWADKVQRLQMFRYPHRYLLEFQVPEPAAYLRWLRKRTDDTETATPPPPPFTKDGKEEEENKSNLLSPEDITRVSYGKYASLFRPSNLSPPPDEKVWVSDAVAVEMEDKTQIKDDPPALLGPPTASKSKEMVIPDGYKAVAARASFTGPPIHAKWKDYPDQWYDLQADGWDNRDGYHSVRADVTLAGTTLTIERTGSKVSVEPSSNTKLPEFRSAWRKLVTDRIALPMAPVAKVNVGVTTAGTFRGSVSVALECELLESAEKAWRLETFTQLLDAHRAWQMQYDSERAAAAVQAGIAIEGAPPERNREIIREELKRQIIEMLLGERFNGFDALTNGDQTKPPRVDLDKAVAAAPRIQFLEQAFEWEKLTFVLYPYFWAAQERWDELGSVADPDSEMARFLRSGSARAVVSVRRGFEHAANHFLLSGVPWAGGPAPAPDDPLYLSVAQEIRDLTGAPDDAEPGESWEVRLPTTLVWLDPDPRLPKHNTRARLARPEEAAAVCSDEPD